MAAVSAAVAASAAASAAAAAAAAAAALPPSPSPGSRSIEKRVYVGTSRVLFRFRRPGSIGDRNQGPGGVVVAASIALPWTCLGVYKCGHGRVWGGRSSVSILWREVLSPEAPNHPSKHSADERASQVGFERTQPPLVIRCIDFDRFRHACTTLVCVLTGSEWCLGRGASAGLWDRSIQIRSVVLAWLGDVASVFCHERAKRRRRSEEAGAEGEGRNARFGGHKNSRAVLINSTRVCGDRKLIEMWTGGKSVALID